MKDIILGIDIGTSGAKIAAFSADTTFLGSVTKKYDTIYPHPGWAEQDPEDWWMAVITGVKKLLSDLTIQPERIAAIGVDAQGWAPVCIDQNGNVLTNTAIWMDTRSKEIAARVKATIGDEIFKTAGNSFEAMYSTPKIMWLKEHHPDIYERTDCILHANGFIVYRLTGEKSLDLSQAYGFHFFNMRTGKWDMHLAEKLGFSSRLLPPLYNCQDIVGQVTSEAARVTGLSAGIPVIAGGLDAVCATLGAGVIADGECQEQGGQAGGITLCTDAYKADPKMILSYHIIPGKWCLQGGTTGGGGVLRWLEHEFGTLERSRINELQKSSFDQMTEQAGKIPPGSDGLIFLPYMSGERTPIWDPQAKGVYYGLDFSKTKGHLIRSSLEGVAYSVRHNIETVEQLGCRVKKLAATGGAANSTLWTQIKADITGKDISVISDEITTVCGVMITAGVGTKIFDSYEQAVKKAVNIQRTQHPNPATRDIYNYGYQTYRQLYENLKNLMHQN